MGASQEAQAETLSFRIDPGLKAALTEIAGAENKPVGALLRELVRERVERVRRRAFEAEARRQSLEAAVAANDPNSDEAAVMREIEAHLDSLDEEWK